MQNLMYGFHLGKVKQAAYAFGQMSASVEAFEAEVVPVLGVESGDAIYEAAFAGFQAGFAAKVAA